MTTHARQDIRDAVVAQLIAAGELSGVTVEATRLAPQREEQLPRVSVYTLDETVDEESHLSAPRKLTRYLNLAVDGWTKLAPSGAIDAQLDDLALKIETALHRDPTFGGKCNDAWLSSTQIGMKLDGKIPMGAVHLAYTVRYFTFAPDTDDVPLTGFHAIDTHYNLGNAQPNVDDQAEDLITGLDP